MRALFLFLRGGFLLAVVWEVARGKLEVFDRRSRALVRRPGFSYSCMRPRPGSAVPGARFLPQCLVYFISVDPASIRAYRDFTYRMS